MLYPHEDLLKVIFLLPGEFFQYNVAPLQCLLAVNALVLGACLLKPNLFRSR